MKVHKDQHEKERLFEKDGTSCYLKTFELKELKLHRLV